MTTYGSKAAQYVDLIVYIILKVSTNSTVENQKLKDFLQKKNRVISMSIIFLTTHANLTIHNTKENTERFHKIITFKKNFIILQNK